MMWPGIVRRRRYPHVVCVPHSACSTPRHQDDTGAGDHAQPFDSFRRQLFATRQLARLLLLRGEVLDARLGCGRWAADLASARSG
jgi:hypothetical protein